MADDAVDRMADYEPEVTAEADPADEMTWNDYTVPQLKEELSVRGLETVGRKADLVERLEKYDSGTFIDLAFIDTEFILSLCMYVIWT